MARIKSGERATIRHMLSLSPSHPIPVFSPRFVRVSISLPSPHHPLLFSLFSSNNTSGRNNGLSDFGKGRGSTAAGIVPPFYQRNYFYALQPSSPPHAFQYFTVALLRLSPSFPTLFNFQDNQAIPPGYTGNFKPRRITCFHSAELFGSHRLVLPFPFLPPSLFLPCNAIVLVRPATREPAAKFYSAIFPRLAAVLLTSPVTRAARS